MTDKIFYYNANFYVPEWNGLVRAVTVVDGIIQALHFLDSDLPADALCIDLKGAWVYPGFIDTHTHSFEGGLYTGGVDLTPCTTVSEVMELMASGLRALRKEETLFAWHLDEQLLAEKRFPTLRELDSLSKDHKILLRRVDGHSCMLNTLARKHIASLQTSDEILRGFDNDKAVHFLHAQLSEETILNAYQRAASEALRGGFITIHTMIGDANQSNTHFKLVSEHLNRFPVNYVLYPQSFNIDSALELGAKRIGGCILADGSLGSHTAALSSPYLDQDTLGVLYQDSKFWHDFISRAHKARLQVAVHCIGDRAIKQINDVYLHLAETDPADLRHELIHAELCPDHLLNEIQASGAATVMQPAFDRYWGGEQGFYSKVLGPDRAGQMNRFRSLTDLGIPVTFGSDWYITDLNALKGIHAAIHHHNPKERIKPADAIASYTEKAAWLSHDENLRGTITIGKEADFTVVDKDLCEAWEPAERSVLQVINKGEIVYDRERS